MKLRQFLLLLVTLAACGGAEAGAKEENPRAAKPAAGAGATAKGERHAVFSLIDNRLLAHAERKHGLIVFAGSGGIAKYLHFGRPGIAWSLRQTRDGRRVAVLDKRGAIDVPLGDAQAKSEAIWLSVHAPTARKVTVKVGGKALKTQSVAAGWQLVTVPVKEGLLAAGENRIEIDGGSGKALALEWLQIGGEAPDAKAADAATPPPWNDEGLALGAGADALVYYAFVPEGAQLEAEVPDKCALAVTATPAEGQSATGTIDKAHGVVDLAAVAGKVVRLRVELQQCAAATVKRAALTLPGATPVVKYPKRPKNVVFWIMDTLRYDRVSLWFPGAIAEVPVMQQLAGSGAVFMHFYPGGNESMVSHASMFTSLLPRTHRIIGRDGFTWKFDKSWTTIGENARAAGLYVAGVTANGHVVRDAGYGFGFHKYENPMQEHKADKDNGYAGEKVLARALELVDGRKDQTQGFFMFVGTIDTHVPYRAHEPWVSKYDAQNPQPYKGPFLKSATAGGINVSFMLSHKAPAPREVLRLIANYASSVSYQDDLVGKLVEQLKAWKVDEDTMIVIAGDHGEEFWEHGIAGHGGSLHEPVVHTPFLVWYPPLLPQTVVEEGVDGVDIYPTVADAMGWPLPPEAQGESLIPLAQGVGRGYPRPAVVSHWEAAWAMWLGGWKLIVENDGDARLYHTEADVNEDTVVEDRPIEQRFVTDAFSTYRVFEVEWRKSKHGVASNMTAVGAHELDVGPAKK